MFLSYPVFTYKVDIVVSCSVCTDLPTHLPILLSPSFHESKIMFLPPNINRLASSFSETLLVVKSHVFFLLVWLGSVFCFLLFFVFGLKCLILLSVLKGNFTGYIPFGH